MHTIAECLEYVAELWPEWCQQLTTAQVADLRDFLMPHQPQLVQDAVRRVYRSGAAKPTYPKLREALAASARDQENRELVRDHAEQAAVLEAQRRRLVRCLQQLPAEQVRQADADARRRTEWMNAGGGLVESWSLGWCVRVVDIMGMDAVAIAGGDR